MEKITHISDDDTNIPEQVRELAQQSFNDAPPNLKEIDEDEYFGYTMTYSSQYRQFRQVRTDDIPYLSMHMEIYGDGSGVAVARDVKGQRRFFKFAVCEHEWETTHASMCYREYCCKKCGAMNAVDSSD